ncbi:MAG: hypothetical protein ABIE47_03220 [Pseudomonadota bacterium]|nr:hypothetical protein [Desulfobacteraceae bacterium]
MKLLGKKHGKNVQGNGPDKKTHHNEELLFNYVFRFEDGEEHSFTINLDPESLLSVPQEPCKGHDWTKLGHNQCENCPLDAQHDPHCPAALSIAGLIQEFVDKFSYETAEITVHTKERNYFKVTTMQKAIASLMGILMPSSGCPVMANLRPMVRFHLPFANILETTFRTTSTYLLGQFFLMKNAETPDFSFEGLVEIYKNVNMVNRAMAKRIRSVAGKDASANALIILDIFALDVPLSIEDQIEGLRPFFSPYFESP